MRALAKPADILLLATRLNVGGPAQQVIALAKGVNADGRWRAVVAAGRPAPSEGEVRDPSVAVTHVPLVRPVHPVTDLAALAKVHRLLGASGVRLVHTHMAKAGTVGRLAATTRHGPLGPARPRLVHTFHGHVLQGYFPRAQQDAFIRLERWLAKRTDVLVAVSPEVRDELLSLGIGYPAQYQVVQLGLDLSRYLLVGSEVVPRGALRRALGLAADVPLAGIVGRLVPVKDHATLFAALSSLPGAHLAVLGDGELRDDLEALAREHGIADRAHFTGWWQDMPEALGDLDVVVLSSRNEGTPVALIEALAAARPVVATDVGGVRHVVQDGQTGWLCGAGDPTALASAMREALSDKEEAASRALEGRRRMPKLFGQDRMLAEHYAIYEELLGRGRSQKG